MLVLWRLDRNKFSDDGNTSREHREMNPVPVDDDDRKGVSEDSIYGGAVGRKDGKMTSRNR